MQSVLEIKGLTTHIKTKAGTIVPVNGVSLSVLKGEIVGIVGESGCGKSMMAMSVLQLLPAAGKIVDGQALFEGADLLGMNKRQMRSIRGDKISMVFQEPMSSLNPTMKVGKQVSESLILHTKASRAEAKERTVQIFQEVGIPDAQRRYNSYPHQLSGGLRQRVMIGLALALKPALMIADEPTTALDVTIEAQILKLMKGMQAASNTSIILITHNLGIIAELCSYVYVMYAGQIMEQAPVFELFAEPKHPYTQGLLKSLPMLGEHREKLHAIPGSVPNLASLPPGCSFCPRCDIATSACYTLKPGLEKISEARKARCLLYSKGVAL